MRLSAIHVYPVKSCAPMAPLQAQVQPRGLAHDRRWLIVDADGRFVTGRQQPRLVLIRAQADAEGLLLRAPQMPPLQLHEPGDAMPRLPVRIWRSEVDANTAGAEADAWISRFVGQPCRLVFMDAAARRAVDSQYGRAGDEVSFADGFPLLLISEASLAGLNARLATPVPMLRFRPNLVIAGTDAHAEDQWKRIRIGEVEFDVVKPCTRCVFTTVDPQTGEFDASGEPLRTLLKYRRGQGGVRFGQNLIPRSQGILRLDDALTVLA